MGAVILICCAPVMDARYRTIFGPNWIACVDGRYDLWSDREVEAERRPAAEAKPQDQACRKIAALCRIRGIGRNLPPCLRARYLSFI